MLWGTQMKMSSMQLGVWSLEEVQIVARCSTSSSFLNCDAPHILKRTEAPNPAAFHPSTMLNTNGKFLRPKRIYLSLENSVESR